MVEQKEIKLPTGQKTVNQVTTKQLDILGFNYSIKRSYELYRIMRNHPTIAIARACATAPILSANWAIDCDDDVNEEIVKFVQRVLDRHWSGLIRNMLFALDYGFQAFEIVWGYDEDERLWTIDKFKSLLPDLTEMVVDDKGE